MEKNRLKSQRDKQQKEAIERLSAKIMKLSRDGILMQLRFLDVAVSSLECVCRWDTGGVCCDGKHLYYDPVYVLRTYQEEPNRISRLYLHILLHCIFYHSFRYGQVESEFWNLAADAAVENTALELAWPGAGLGSDEEALRKLHGLKGDSGGLTAEKIYRHLKRDGIGVEEKRDFIRLFRRDSHASWKEQEELSISQEQWKKISERVRTDLKTFSRDKNNSQSLEQNLAEALRERYDYGELLRRFTVMGESIRVNDEEFDYVYYTYGLEHYGNMPLVEPLEYKEENKVREFVIAIDTSASCRGEMVRAFLRKTYSILKGTENFFHKMNVHIVQCDNEVQSDKKITSQEDFDRFLLEGKLHGFGATDFRPVFEYVENLNLKGEFENLKGLIYFTDGYGIYPEQMPAYDVIFAFPDEDDNRMPPPPWAVQVVLRDEDMEESGDEY